MARLGEKVTKGEKKKEKKKKEKLSKKSGEVLTSHLDHVLSYLTQQGHEEAVKSILAKRDAPWKAENVKKKAKRLIKWAEEKSRSGSAKEAIGHREEPETDDGAAQQVTGIMAEQEEPTLITEMVSLQPLEDSPMLGSEPLAPSAATVTTQTMTTKASERGTAASAQLGGRPIRFQRIKVEEQVYHDDRLKDMSYGAKGRGSAQGNDWGARANADLIVTRGKGFRKEKDKKKRGSYRGGTITEEVHSVRFPGSDSE